MGRRSSDQGLLFKTLLGALPKEAAPQPPLSMRRRKTLPSAAADWVRNGHLTRLDQSDARPRRGLETPWGFLAVYWRLERAVPGLAVGLGEPQGGAPGRRPGEHAGAAGGAGGRKKQPRGEAGAEALEQLPRFLPAPGGWLRLGAAALPVLDSAVASRSSHKSSRPSRLRSGCCSVPPGRPCLRRPRDTISSGSLRGDSSFSQTLRHKFTTSTWLPLASQRVSFWVHFCSHRPPRSSCHRVRRLSLPFPPPSPAPHAAPPTPLSPLCVCRLV